MHKVTTDSGSITLISEGLTKREYINIEILKAAISNGSVDGINMAELEAMIDFILGDKKHEE